MARIWISLGSNIEREHNIRSALSSLAAQFDHLIHSSLYESDAVGFDGPGFYNMVVGCDSAEDVLTTAKILKRIEVEHGRTWHCQKFSPRTLDLDLILYDDLILDQEHLKLPRKDILEYAFVLEPLAEIAPYLRHPITHQSYSKLWAEFDKSNLIQQVLPMSD
jgi:2-amino-4-hydroxy-6-hydroxymethyldihydropteridine diphosphokinase